MSDLPRFQIESFTFVFMHFFHKEQPNIFIKGLSFKSRGGWGFLVLLGNFGYSLRCGGTLSDFFIFFSPWLYLLITTSSSLKAVEQYPKSSPKVTQNHHFGLPFLSPWVSWRIFTFGSGLWGSYQRYDKNMRSFCDFD